MRKGALWSQKGPGSKGARELLAGQEPGSNTASILVAGSERGDHRRLPCMPPKPPKPQAVAGHWMA
jgi:hypothetical protein